MKAAKQAGFQTWDIVNVGRVRPDKRDLPYVDLPIGDYVGSSGGQVTANARPDAILALADIDWHTGRRAHKRRLHLLRASSALFGISGFRTLSRDCITSR